MYTESQCLSERVLALKPRPLNDPGTIKAANALLIEDDRTMRRLVGAKLSDHCRLYDAPDASQGITIYNELKPDIVFMDIELPDGDGHDLLSWILRNDPNAFIVMFSGHHSTDNVLKSIEYGAKGFIAKPFDLEKMLHFLKICPRLH